MSRTPTPRRHHHLSRESIAQAALELIDSDGLHGLTMRNLAARLGVRATNLYPYVPDKDSLLCEVVALLLSEVDLSERPGVGWEECAVSVGLSVREMAMRHPQAFSLVALTPYDEWPFREHSQRVARLFSSVGLPEHQWRELASALDAYSTGYLLIATQVIANSSSPTEDDIDREPGSTKRAAGVTNTLGEYEEGIRMLITGFAARHMAGGESDGSRRTGG